MSERRPGEEITGNEVVDDYYYENWDSLLKREKRDPSLLSEVEMVFFSIWVVDGNVGNGGWWQALENNTRHLVPAAHRSLVRIGATKAADIMGQVLALMPPHTDWNDQDEIELALEEVSDQAAEAMSTLEEPWLGARDAIYAATAAFMERQRPRH